MGLSFYEAGPFLFTVFSVFLVIFYICSVLTLIWYLKRLFMVILMGVLWVLIVKYFFLRFGDFLLWFQIFSTPLASDSYPPFFFGVPNFLHVINSITQLCALWAKYWLMWQDRCVRTKVAPISWEQPMSSWLNLRPKSLDDINSVWMWVCICELSLHF